jgi:hypothetical protein
MERLPLRRRLVMEDFDVVTGPSPSRMPPRVKAPSPRPSPRGEREKEREPAEPEKAQP